MDIVFKKMKDDKEFQKALERYEEDRRKVEALSKKIKGKISCSGCGKGIYLGSKNNRYLVAYNIVHKEKDKLWLVNPCDQCQVRMFNASLNSWLEKIKIRRRKFDKEAVEEHMIKRIK